jgi:uncharacterized damage-inducible protein DinB
MKNSAHQQYGYHQWANNRFFEHLKVLPKEICSNEIQSVFSSVSEVIIHIYQVDALWLSVMSGDPFEETMTKIEQIQKRSADKSLDQMQQLYAELAEQYRTFFNKLGDLDSIISIEHPQYGKLETAVFGIGSTCRQSRHLPSWEYHGHAAAARTFRCGVRLYFLSV